MAKLEIKTPTIKHLEIQWTINEMYKDFNMSAIAHAISRRVYNGNHYKTIMAAMKLSSHLKDSYNIAKTIEVAVLISVVTKKHEQRVFNTPKIIINKKHTV